MKLFLTSDIHIEDTHFRFDPAVNYRLQNALRNNDLESGFQYLPRLSIEFSSHKITWVILSAG
jgi:hypothetical protein